MTQHVKITEKHLQSRILYPAKILHRNEGEIKTSSDEGELIICCLQASLKITSVESPSDRRQIILEGNLKHKG